MVMAGVELPKECRLKAAAGDPAPYVWEGHFRHLSLRRRYDGIGHARAAMLQILLPCFRTFLWSENGEGQN
eukprot:3074340-Amphidinium_carterae.1